MNPETSAHAIKPLDRFVNVPSELLTEIFKFSSPCPVIIPGPRGGTSSPWSLCLVSKRWQTIAQDTAELWTNVFVNYEDTNSIGERPAITVDEMVNDEMITAIARRFLSRGKRALLSLKIESDAHDLDGRAPLVVLVLDNAHRLRHLELKLSVGTFDDLSRASPIFSKNLEFLSVSSFNIIDHLQATSLNSPGLRAIEVDGCVPWLKLSPDLTWGHLEHLSITKGCRLSLTITLGVMRRCHNLVTLQIMTGV